MSYLKKDHLLSFSKHGEIILTNPVQIDVIKEGPDDNKVLACAIDTEADYIVSGDNHLLNLRHYKNISIVTVRELLEIMGET